MNIELLKKAIENDDNLGIIYTNIQDIKAQKNDILQGLGIKKMDLKKFHSKLKDYRYLDDIKDLKYGNNIRWINLNNIKNINITNGAMLCDIKISDKGISLCLKAYNNKYFTIYLNENLIFQKISEQEQVILKAIKYLSN